MQDVLSFQKMTVLFFIFIITWKNSFQIVYICAAFQITNIFKLALYLRYRRLYKQFRFCVDIDVYVVSSDIVAFVRMRQ